MCSKVIARYASATAAAVLKWEKWVFSGGVGGMGKKGMWSDTQFFYMPPRGG
jgi:hypothetical protein